MNKAFSVYIKDKKSSRGMWLDLPQYPEQIDKAITDMQYENYEIIETKEYPFKYKSVFKENIHKVNNFALVCSEMTDERKENIIAYFDSLGNKELSFYELINMCSQADKIPYFKYELNEIGNINELTNEEKFGYTMAIKNGIYKVLKKSNALISFDFKEYGKNMSNEYKLLNNGYIDLKNDIDLNFSTEKEIELSFKYMYKDYRIRDQIDTITEKFENLTKSDSKVVNYFKNTNNKDNFSNLRLAGCIIGGMSIRNSWRKNGKLEGKMEHSPYSKEQEELIDKLSDLYDERENLEEQYEDELAELDEEYEVSTDDRNVYHIEKDKTIPILESEIELPTKNNIFDEEITINVDGIYIDNRIRLVINKKQDYISIYTASFEEQGGLCYWQFDLSNEEYMKFKTINDFINAVFIEGCYNDFGVSVATGKHKEDFADKDITDDMF